MLSYSEIVFRVCDRIYPVNEYFMGLKKWVRDTQDIFPFILDLNLGERKCI
jgi:hypothetical protein